MLEYCKKCSRSFCGFDVVLPDRLSLHRWVEESVYFARHKILGYVWFIIAGEYGMTVTYPG